MIRTLPLLLLAAIFASCTRFHYVTVSGVNVPKSSHNELISENDTLRIEYRFTRNNGLVSVRLFNKSTEPLEVDWRKPAIIVADKTVGYYNGKQPVSGQIESSSLQFARRTSTSAYLNGEIQSSEQVQFIPPQSYVESKPLVIPLQPITALPEERAENLSFKYGGENPIQYKGFLFEEGNTPAKFRSYLTLRLGKTGEEKEFAIDHQFYISEIWKSQSQPLFFKSSPDNRGDRFYRAHQY